MRAFYHNPVEKRIRQYTHERSERVYEDLPKAIPKYKSKKKFISVDLPLRLKIFRFLLKPITNLNEALINSPLVAKMSRPLVCFPMRNLLYAEYKMHVLLRHIVRFFGSEGRKMADRIDFRLKLEEKAKNCRPLTEVESLRKINEKIRAKLPPQQTLTERNQQILYLGR